MDTNKNSVLLEEGRKELAEALEHGIRSTHAPFALHLEADDKVTTFAFTYLNEDLRAKGKWTVDGCAYNEDVELPLASSLEMLQKSIDRYIKTFDEDVLVDAGIEDKLDYETFFHDARIRERDLEKLSDLVLAVQRYECGNDKSAYENWSKGWKARDADRLVEKLEAAAKKLAKMGVKPKTVQKIIQNAMTRDLDVPAR